MSTYAKIPSLSASLPTFATVGIASGLALAANVTRAGLSLINTSNSRMSLAFGSPAVLNSGIVLLPSQSWQMNEYSFTTQAVFAIAAVAGSNLAIQEYTA